MTRILGCDPGSIHCGYGCIDVDGAAVRYVECGVIDARAKAHRFDRLGEIGRGLLEVIAELEPDELAMEEGFVQRVNGALTLGESRGVVILVAALSKLPLTGYAPATIKKAVAGHGGADKDIVARAVMARLGLQTQPAPDASDALAIALTHALGRST